MHGYILPSGLVFDLKQNTETVCVTKFRAEEWAWIDYNTNSTYVSQHIEPHASSELMQCVAYDPPRPSKASPSVVGIPSDN